MNYPFWDVPHIGSGWVIGIIAIFHVMISHFAVGGGFYLVLAERKALRENRQDWLEILRGHSKFFLILTGVFGAASGVGIWFAIGLAHPEATSTLIHNFVFGWAIEWVFFIVELTTAAVYYYTYGRVSNELHLKVGWLYAAASLLTLVIINGILTFMLTPGQAWLNHALSGREADFFWQAFFNPTYWPSLVLRTLVCVSLAGIWALVTCSRLDGETHGNLKTELVRWSSKWLIPSFFLMPFVMVWYLLSVPETQRELLKLGISTIGSGAFTQVTRVGLVIIMASATIVLVVYFLAWRSPKDFTFSHAVSVLLLGLVATGAGEYTRETLRKPYVVGQHMYSNGVRVKWVEKYNKEGYLKHSPWVRQDPSLPPAMAVGEAMFRGQCMSCHTRDAYRSMERLLAGRNRESIGNVLKILHENGEPYRRYMPPLVGTAEEIKALGDYLAAMVAPKTNAAPAALAARP
ncbi:cytochrome ubiquinol oxidase subunit I [Fontisphaera persica]|uniref:cytochrome ubiquinol oxidase subunit I n=1 Tax=Fontisphaera persica TaxID=2974023 RepID=UPI0024BF76BB|nr:cytochrome ubiquinol oxidase subunit I [Fontisphaera persica]WCJ59917.1 cytochrome ubiquinol oxidase subunit I [Fontisphaera persica]